jgi:hypothetical protein
MCERERGGVGLERRRVKVRVKLREIYKEKKFCKLFHIEIFNFLGKSYRVYDFFTRKLASLRFYLHILSGKISYTVENPMQ